MEHEGHLVLHQKSGKAGDGQRMRIEVEGQGEVADVVHREDGPVAHDQGLHIFLEGDATLELLGAESQVVQLLELGATAGWVHRLSPDADGPRHRPLKAPSAAIASNALA
jgi:hypothetical protein